MIRSLPCPKIDFAKLLQFHKHLRFRVVQNEVNSFLIVKLDVTRQVTVRMGVDAQGKARMPLLPAEKAREVGLTIQPY